MGLYEEELIREEQWDISHWNKKEEEVRPITKHSNDEATKQIREAQALLDEYFGALGDALNLPERLEFILLRQAAQIEELHHEAQQFHDILRDDV